VIPQPIIRLRVSRMARGPLAFEVIDDGTETFATGDAPDLQGYLASLREAWNEVWQSPRLAGPVLAPALRAAPVPPGVFLRLAEIARTGAARGTGAAGTAAGRGASGAALLVETADAELAALPWEVLPAAHGLPGLGVARLGRPAPGAAGAGPAGAGARAVLADASTVAGGDEREAAREMDGVARLLRPSFAAAPRLVAPTLEQLEAACARDHPAVLHLALEGVRGDPPRQGLALLLGDGRGGFLAHPPGDVAAKLAGAAPELRLVVLSGADTGGEAAHAFARALPGAAIVGWFGATRAAIVADFSLALYGALIQGRSAFDAIRRFLAPREGFLSADAGVPVAPAIWLPGADAFDVGLPAGEGAAGFRSIGPSPWPAPASDTGDAFRGTLGPAPAVDDEGVSVAIDPVPAICPALLLNGRSPVERLTLASASPQARIQVTIACDTGSGTSVWRETVSLAPAEPLSFPTERLNFPALYELMARGVNRRQVNLTVTVAAGSRLLAEVTRPILYLGPTEWLDQEQTWPYIPSYVLAESRGVKQVIKKAEARLGDGVSFCGYQQGMDLAHRQVGAIYEALRQDFKITYINPPGSPVYLAAPEAGAGGADGTADGAAAPPPEPVRTAPVRSGQRVRFPNEVLEHQQGTCHDLALLLAACAENVGLRPLVVLIPAHTFVGYWGRRVEHDAYWDRRRRSSLGARFGDLWLIRRAEDLEERVRRDDIRLVEATALTRRGDRSTPFERACEEGGTHLSRHRLDCAVDVWASRSLVEPLYRAWAREVEG